MTVKEQPTKLGSDLKNSISWLRLTCFAQFAGIFVVIALIVWQTYLFNEQFDDIDSKLSLILIELQDIRGNVKNLSNLLDSINNRLDNIEKYLGIRP